MYFISNRFKGVNLVLLYLIFCSVSGFMNISCQQNQMEGCMSFKNDFDNYGNWGFSHLSLVKGEGHSGDYYCKTDSLNRYGMGLNLTLKDFEKCKPTRMVVSGWVKCMKLDNGSALVATFDSESTSLSWNGIDLSKDVKEVDVWTFVTAEYPFPKNLPAETDFKFFLWNNGTDPVFVDDMSLVFIQ